MRKRNFRKRSYKRRYNRGKQSYVRLNRKVNSLLSKVDGEVKKID